MSTSALWEPISPAADYVVVTPTGSLSSTNLQSALAELDTEKAAASHTHAVTDVLITSATDIGADLADGDEVPVYDLSATANKKSAFSRIWTYIASKLSFYTGILGGSGLTLTGTTATDSPTLSAELLTSAGWTVNAGWTESPDDTFAHTNGGGTATLTHSATIANSTKYQLTYTITGRTAGTITVTFGGATTSEVSATGSFGPTTSSTAAFTVTPTTDFDGTCIFSLRAITTVSTALVILNDSTSTPRISIRANNQLNNQFIGYQAGQYNTTGYQNTANGVSALYSNTTGYNNTANGVSALQSNTTGYYNTANGLYALHYNTTGYNNTANGVSALYYNTTGYQNTANGLYALHYNTTGYNNTANGVSALHSNTTGYNNTANGAYALYSNTTGYQNTANGMSALYSNTTGYQNTALGYQSGRYAGSGTTTNQTSYNSIYIGYDVRSAASGDTNEIVIGNSTVGLGSNSTVIGNSSTTLIRLYGDITTGVDSPSAAIHAIKTTEQLRLGYDASKYLSVTIDSAGAATFKPTTSLVVTGNTSTDGPTLGAELLSSAGWTVNAGWVESPDDTFVHTGGGGTATLTHSATIANATRYQLTYTITGRTAGTITVTFGGTTSNAVSATGSFGPTTSSAAAFTVTPTDDFNGTCVFSLKAITAASSALVILNDSTSTPRVSIRANNQLNNQFIGYQAGQYNTTGYQNTANGFQALYSNTTGHSNTANGFQALYSNTTGHSNTANGLYALYSNTTGYQNTANGVKALYYNTTGYYNTANGLYALYSNTTGYYNTANGFQALCSNTTGYQNTANGFQALYSNTTGYQNTANGLYALYSNTTGYNNTANGYQAGYYAGSGTTPNQTSNKSIYLGFDVRAAADGDTNEIVIGNSTVGLGSNTTVIGNSSTTLTRLYGNIATGVDSPSAKVHAIATTEQLRLGYDAANYASFTVSTAGVLALTTSANKIALGTSRTPASAADTGTAGEVCWDDNYLYVCVATNTWKRASLATWS